jgi:hypothetical protein
MKMKRKTTATRSGDHTNGAAKASGEPRLAQNMVLLPYAKFAKLRLQKFDRRASDDRDWGGSAGSEFLNLYWYNESVRGVEFLSHEDDPDRLGGACLDFRYMDRDLIAPLLLALGLPLTPGVSSGEVSGILGPPIAREDGAPGCTVLDFLCGAGDRYWIRCYFTDGGGLHGVDIIRGDLMAQTGMIKDEKPAV